MIRISDQYVDEKKLSYIGSVEGGMDLRTATKYFSVSFVVDGCLLTYKNKDFHECTIFRDELSRTLGDMVIVSGSVKIEKNTEKSAEIKIKKGTDVFNYDAFKEMK